MNGVNVRSRVYVPLVVWMLLAAALFTQVLFKLNSPDRIKESAASLPPPVSAQVASLATLNEPLAAARLMLVWLQMFDNQPGVSIPFRELDYGRVIAWLERAMELDPQTRYPLALASRVYAEVGDGNRQRMVWEWVYEKFLQAPDERWNWMAHVTIMAKHRGGDLALARRYADAVREHATAEHVPFWARDLVFGVLEDLGELEALQILIAGQIESGAIRDQNELRFLHWKLQKLADRSVENPTQ